MSSRKIICAVSGKAYTFAKDYFDKKVSEYGDEDSLKKYFITRKVKGYLNKGYSVQEIRNILTTDDESLPGSDSQDMKDMIEKVLADKSLTIFLAIVIVGLLLGWVGG